VVSYHIPDEARVTVVRLAAVTRPVLFTSGTLVTYDIIVITLILYYIIIV
jgi:hypothetical protein